MAIVTEAWQRHAACKGPRAEFFFPPTSPERKEDRMARERDAKAICATCDVRGECLEYAMRIREAHGIWGGTNEMERRDLAERRAS
ncbi:MAG TPA: WhiB family transcriptional regulator [Acidimicrobiales bacterium]|nr:WhiB family transcriptional regulator [Acidimicrobiales bacterium]